ncbi:PTS sugar transporter subunit IIB [Parafannyhessea umbonata]|uniref:PTS EIIB type-2 domain-containing protein n=1 Tax=Parafannyhessea umbonata TaxID=604330 RepID=A0A1H9QWN0_9ACTN|nr:PTS sugar transporter subunit IIB [Parafannyhessea umbonata]SER64239.1 PTS system unknown substrate IIB component, Gat family [Parafannyhessea umbonata]
MAKKRVLFVCATGIATSTVVEEKVCEYLREEGIDFDADQRNLGSVPSIADDFDLIVATTQIPFEVKEPVVSGLPFLTGFGAEEALQKIKTVLAD